MATRHPKYRLRSGDVLDPNMLNRTLAPAAEEVGGKLNEHNFTFGPFDRSKFTTKAYYTPRFTEQNIDPALATGGYLDPLQPNVHILDDDYEWQTISGGGSSLTFTTGEDNLWIIGWAQFAVFTNGSYGAFQANENNQHSEFATRMQFAVRVDGSILEHTITGVSNPFDRPPMGIRPLLPRTTVSPTRATAGLSIKVNRPEDCQAIGRAVCAVRVGAMITVPEGSHTIELVCRRSYPVNVQYQGIYTRTCVFARRLFALQMSMYPKSTGGATVFGISGLNDGDAVSKANIETDRLAPIVSELNDVREGAIYRGALMAEHLPSMVFYPQNAGQASGNNTTSTYPAYVAATDSGATPLRVDGNGANYDFVANPGFVIVLGNLHAQWVGDPGTISANDIASVGITLVFDDATTSTPVGNRAFTNSNNQDQAAAATDNLKIDIDIPVFGFFDYRTVPPVKPIDYFQLGVSAFNFGSPTPTFIYENGNILVLAFRP